MPAPAKPAAPVRARTAPRSTSVAWAAVTGATSWSVRYRTAGETPGQYVTVTGLPAGTRQHSLANLAAATAYEVSVRASNADGDSPWSDAVQWTTQEDESMGILQPDLTLLQAAKETTEGDALAATMRFPYVTAAYTPMTEWTLLEERGTVLADTEDEVTGRGSQLEITEHLNSETILWPLLGSLADVDSAASNSARRWLFTPAIRTPSGLATVTWEIVATDGGSDAYVGRFSFARCTGWSVTADTGIAQMTSTWMGRARKELATPAALTAPARWVTPAVLWTAYIDDSFAALGTTKMATLRSLNLSVDPGIEGAPALTGREDLDVSYWLRGRIRGTVDLVVDHDADASTELAHWEAGDLRYIRLEATNGASGAALRRIRIDAVVRWISSPDVLQTGDSVHTLTLAGQLRADTADNILAVEVVNGLTTV